MNVFADHGRLADILIALDTIETYLTTETNEQLIRDGVKYQLIVIGEASRGLSAHARDLTSEIPWQRILAFHNFVVHEYASVDPHTVATIITDHLPALEVAVLRLLDDLGLRAPDDVGPPP